MTKKHTIIVPAESTGSRLDIFLSDILNISRSQVQKLIHAKQVWVNDKDPKKPGDNLKENYVITYKETTPKQIKKILTTAYNKDNIDNENIISRPIASSDDIVIIDETDDYIVINKPSGLLTHPTQAKEKDSVAKWIIKKYPKLKKVGEDPVRPGIVHRLDKDASGLLVIAKTQEMFEHLKQQFKNRTVIKEYSTLVHGRPAKDWDEISFPIARSETSDKMAAIPQTYRGLNNTTTLPTEYTDNDEELVESSQIKIRGKEALTEFLIEKRFVNFALLKVTIHTGRTHQIRVHMLAYGNPVVGDPLYYQRKQKRIWDQRCNRIFLHSTKLEFTKIDNEQASYTSKLPKNLTDFLSKLR